MIGRLICTKAKAGDTFIRLLQNTKNKNGQILTYISLPQAYTSILHVMLLYCIRTTSLSGWGWGCEYGLALELQIRFIRKQLVFVESSVHSESVTLSIHIRYNQKRSYTANEARGKAEDAQLGLPFCIISKCSHSEQRRKDLNS